MSYKQQNYLYIQTDAGMFYPRAFRKMFYSNKFGGLTVEHRIQNYQKTRVHNYRIETVFMKIKDRVLDFRGLKDSGNPELFDEDGSRSDIDPNWDWSWVNPDILTKK